MLANVFFCGKTSFERLQAGKQELVSCARNPVVPGVTVTVIKMDKVGRATNESVRVVVIDESPASKAWADRPSMSIWVQKQPKAEQTATGD